MWNSLHHCQMFSGKYWPIKDLLLHLTFPSCCQLAFLPPVPLGHPFWLLLSTDTHTHPAWMSVIKSDFGFLGGVLEVDRMLITHIGLWGTQCWWFYGKYYFLGQAESVGGFLKEMTLDVVMPGRGLLINLSPFFSSESLGLTTNHLQYVTDWEFGQVSSVLDKTLY